MSNNIYRLCFAVGCIIFGHFNGFSQIIINEIHYNPDVKTEPVEFVELFNKGTIRFHLQVGISLMGFSLHFHKAQ